jgi:hypothetical protein
MADEANKPLDADELSEDALQEVAGGSTPLKAPEIKVTGSLTGEGTQSDSGKTIAGWDIAKNSAS